MVVYIKVERLDVIPPITTQGLVKVTEMGNIIEVQYMSRQNACQTVRMLKGMNEYVVLATGEVKDVCHGVTRRDNKNGLFKTFSRLRALINTNVTDVSKVRWCTLTYAENMTDTKRLYKDFEKFNKRFQYYCTKNGFGKAEYIVVAEPQMRGAWHLHLLYIWKHLAPFIPNDVFRGLWGHGFVKIKQLDDIDNVGAYLTAYLGDLDMTDCDHIPPGAKCEFKEVREGNATVSKAIVKGARLHLYPANFNLYRCSRGCARPQSQYMTQEKSKEKVLGATKTFESAVRLFDNEHDFENLIIKTQYNRICK